MKLSCAKIVAEMKRQRLTSSSLANKALCSVSTVQAVRNERNVSENSAKRIAQALGVTVDDLKEDLKNMIHLIGDYYMTADKKPGCSYVVGIPRQTEDKRIIMRQSRYYTTLARAVAETAEIALRDKIAAGEITTLHDAVEAFRCMKDEIIASIGDQKED